MLWWVSNKYTHLLFTTLHLANFILLKLSFRLSNFKLSIVWFRVWYSSSWDMDSYLTGAQTCPFLGQKLALARHKSSSGLAIYYDRVLLSITTRADRLLCLELVAYYDGEGWWRAVKSEPPLFTPRNPSVYGRFSPKGEGWSLLTLIHFLTQKRNYGMIKMCWTTALTIIFNIVRAVL